PLTHHREGESACAGRLPRAPEEITKRGQQARHTTAAQDVGELRIRSRHVGFRRGHAGGGVTSHRPPYELRRSGVALRPHLPWSDAAAGGTMLTISPRTM